MNLFTARILSFLLMLLAFPLLSIGTTTSLPFLWWLGMASLSLGASIPPVMRFVPAPQPQDEQRHEVTDLSESSRVC